MNKKQFAVVIVFAFMMTAGAYIARASEVINPLPREEVDLFLKQLNGQGKLVSFAPGAKEDRIAGRESEDRSFYLEGAPGSWYYLYKADINNDGKDEYVLCSVTGPEAFFDINSIYHEKDGKLVDIFDEIKMPLRNLIRDAEKQDYNLEGNYSGLMGGSIKIEKDQDKVFFTLEKLTRRYAGEGSKEDSDSPQGYKFLWDEFGINLVEYLGDKVYKP